MAEHQSADLLIRPRWWVIQESDMLAAFGGPSDGSPSIDDDQDFDVLQGAIQEL